MADGGQPGVGAGPDPGPTFPGKAAVLPTAGGLPANLPASLLLGCQASRVGGSGGAPASPISSLGSPQVRSEAFPGERGVGVPPGCPHIAPPPPLHPPRPRLRVEPAEPRPGRNGRGSCEGLCRDTPARPGARGGPRAPGKLLRRGERGEPPGKHATARSAPAFSPRQCLPRESPSSF